MSFITYILDTFRRSAASLGDISSGVSIMVTCLPLARLVRSCRNKAATCGGAQSCPHRLSPLRIDPSSSDVLRGEVEKR
jgi:hypothetical protein